MLDISIDFDDVLFWKYKYKSICFCNEVISYLYYKNYKNFPKCIVIVILYSKFKYNRMENYVLNKMIDVLQLDYNEVCVLYIYITNKKYNFLIYTFINYELEKYNCYNILLLDEGRHNKLILNNSFFIIRTYSPRDLLMCHDYKLEVYSSLLKFKNGLI
ncbi:MAG: hypothetical protein HYZ30_00315 [Candidatus Azosocius agrarius]|nr:MAG: hypothetical protein HYZ30_00315 [Gammaproteobacteria bacterium]